jgi:hypothetical protein
MVVVVWVGGVSFMEACATSEVWGGSRRVVYKLDPRVSQTWFLEKHYDGLGRICTAFSLIYLSVLLIGMALLMVK